MHHQVKHSEIVQFPYTAYFCATTTEKVDSGLVMEMNVYVHNRTFLARLRKCKFLKNIPVSDVQVSLHEFTLCQGWYPWSFVLG
jgi:hypothetical protein